MATLQNFGVPLGGGAGRGGILQPMTKNRFRVRVYRFGPVAGGIEFTQQVMSVQRPSANFNPVEVHSYNSIASYAGKATWQPITVTLRDDVSKTIGRLVGHQMQKQMNFFEQTTALAGSNYKFETFIEALDGGNDGVLEQWYLEGCLVESTGFDQYDYSTADPMTIELTIKYDNATLEGGLMPLIPELGTGPLIG